MATAPPNRYIESVWLAHCFLNELVLIFPVYAIMMLDAGISAVELAGLFVIWSLSALLFEIPSGVVGDLVNRKRYIALGSLIRAGGFLMWLVYPEIAGFALGFVLWSCGSAIHSGTLQALLHDVLAEQGRPEEFARIYGRGKSMESAGVLAAMVAGGFLAEFGYGQVLVLSATAPLLAAGLIIMYVTEPPRTHAEVKAGFSATLRAAFGTLLENRTIALIAAMFVFFMGAGGVVDEYIGPLLEEPGVLSLGTIGMLYGGILGARAIGTALAHRLRALGLRRIGMVSVLAHGLLFVGMSSGLVWLVVASALYFAVIGAVEVLLEANLQQEIEMHARATITSLAGAGLEVWGMVLFLLIGLRAETHGWSAAIAAAALIAMAISVLLAYVAGPVTARIRS